jgi:hypothetical protein
MAEANPSSIEPFHQTMRKLVKIPKAELDAEEKKYQRRKRAKKAPAG